MVNQPSARSEMKPLTEDWGYDNVLLGQDYRIPHGMVIDEYGAMVEWWLARENQRSQRKTGSSATLSTTNITWIHPELNLGLLGEKLAPSHLSYDMAYGKQ
jgi:hypothetical protein